LLQGCYTCRRVSSTSNLVKQYIIFIDQGRVRELEGFKFLSQSLYDVNLIFKSLCHLVVLGFLALLGHQALVIINTKSWWSRNCRCFSWSPSWTLGPSSCVYPVKTGQAGFGNRSDRFPHRVTRLAFLVLLILGCGCCIISVCSRGRAPFWRHICTLILTSWRLVMLKPQIFVLAFDFSFLITLGRDVIMSTWRWVVDAMASLCMLTLWSWSLHLGTS
jgi:hypothetical protein